MSEVTGKYTIEEDDQVGVGMFGQGYEQVRVRDESNDRKYFTITPRIVKAYARNAHDLALWETIKDIAGEDGECYLNTEQLAILSGVSTGQVSNSRKYWIKIGFLKGEIKRDPGFTQKVWHLTVPDLWQKNIEWCEKHPKIADRIAFRKAHRSLHRVKPSPSEGLGSPSETKKKLIKKNQKDFSPSEIQEIKDSANRTVDGILANGLPPADYWQGREIFRPDHLPLVDWYHKVTGQVCTKRVQKSWLKAVTAWAAEGITPVHLQTAFENQSKWRMVSDPNMLTNDAAAVKAAGVVTAQPQKRGSMPSFDSNGRIINA